MAKPCGRCRKNGRFQRNLAQVPVVHKDVARANYVAGVLKTWNLRWNLPQVPPSKMAKPFGRCRKNCRFQRNRADETMREVFADHNSEPKIGTENDGCLRGQPRVTVSITLKPAVDGQPSLPRENS